MEKITRGMRNNNPFNIRKSNNKWYGKVPGKDNEFETFDTLLNGYRAGIALLCTYYNNYHLHTIFDVINRFAPSLENNTFDYIKYVSKQSHFEPYQRLSLLELLDIVAPIIAYYESRCILPSEIRLRIVRNYLK